MLVLCGSVAGFIGFAHATALPSWTDKAVNIAFQEVRTLEQGELLPPQFSSQVRVPCESQSIRTKTKDRLGIVPGISDEYKEMCMVSMGFGQISSEFLKLDGYRDALENKSRRTFVPVANSNTVFMVDTTGYLKGGLLHRIPDMRLAIDIQMGGTPLQQDSFTLASYGDVIKNAEGNGVLVDPGSIAISNNGRWLSGNTIDGKQFRLEVFSPAPISLFGSKVDYFKGFDPSVRTAISNDGKFVAFSHRGSIPTLLKTEGCDNPEAAGCSKNLSDATAQITGGDAGYLRFSFKDDSRFQAHINAAYEGAVRKTKVYNIFPDASTKNAYAALDAQDRYLALGDSFASGEGAFNYRDGTDHPDNRCHQSLVAYSKLITQDIGIDRNQSVACSGAVLQDIVFKSDSKDDEDPEDQYNKDERQSGGKEDKSYTEDVLNRFLPGYRQQIRYLERYRPNIVTVSIGGNDIGFGDKIKTCLASSSSCYNTSSDRLQMFHEIKSKFDPLRDRLRAIKEKSADNARIYVIGYPQFFPEGGGDNCELNMPFGIDERRMANDLVHDLNQTIKKATESVGVQYVDVETAMQEHRFCEESSDVAFNGVTAGNDLVKLIGYPLGKESFHPDRLGHGRFASSIMRQTNNFTTLNPKPNSSITEEGIESFLTSSIAANEAVAGLAVSVNKPEMAPDIIFSENPEFDLSVGSGSLAPNTNYTINIHSTPVELGSFRSDDEGSLTTKLTLPADIVPGFHTLHITGQSQDGEPVDLYKIVYIASSEEDADGDGTPNDDEACLVVEPSGIDYDQDEIDDACDGQIDDPPPDEDPPEIVIIPGPTPLPDFDPSTQNQKPLPNNETVAGNEELSPAEEAIVTSEEVAPNRPAQVAADALGARATLADVQPQTISQDVLGTSRATNLPAAALPPLQERDNVPYLILGLFFLLTLVLFLWRAKAYRAKKP